MTETQAVEIVHPLAELGDPIVAIDGAVIARIEQLVKRARTIRVTDRETFERADAWNADLRAFKAELERNRKALKAPVIALGKQIDRVHAQATVNLEQAAQSLSAQIVAFQAEERRKAAEAEAKRAQAIREAQEAERRAAAEAAKMKPAAAARALARSAELKRDKIATASEPPPEPVKSKSVVERTQRRVVIVERGSVPMRSPRGVPLWVIDEVAVRKAALAGEKIPGVEIVEDTITATKGGAASLSTKRG